MPRTACTDFAGQCCPSGPPRYHRKEASAAGVSHLAISVSSACMHRCRVLFSGQVRHVASKLSCYLFNCSVDHALMYDAMYALISMIIIATCSCCFVYSVMLLL